MRKENHAFYTKLVGIYFQQLFSEGQKGYHGIVHELSAPRYVIYRAIYTYVTEGIFSMIFSPVQSYHVVRT